MSDAHRWLAACSMALAMLLALGSALATSGRVQAQDASAGPAASPLAEQEVFGFLPSWELANAASIDLETLTTLAWFSLEAGRDGRLVRETDEGEPTPGWAGWNSAAFDDLLERAEAAGVRVVLTVERFSWDRDDRRATRALLSDPAARSRLVADIVDVITTRGVGGVNLDVEPLPNAVRGDFVRLVRELRAAFDAVDPSLQLTFDLTPDVDSFPVARLVGPSAAHAVVLMGYEYRTAASRIAGSVAPLRDRDGLDVRESLARTIDRVPAGRIILALPWYGRAWSTRGRQTDARTRRSDRYIAPSTALYRSAVARAAVAGRRYDREQAAAWSVYRSAADAASPLSWRQLWYDDVDSVRAKAGLARRRGLLGVGIWALGYEGGRPELWSALRYALSPGADASPPVGSASVAADSAIGRLADMPVVGDTIEVELSASDGPDGSGVAFVRLATGGRLLENGALRGGTTFPAVDSVRISLPDGGPVDEVFVPGGGDPPPVAGTDVTEGGAQRPLGRIIDTVVVRVQWRDVAGNWSEPTELPVALLASAPQG